MRSSGGTAPLKQAAPARLVKSGLMAGLGETPDELLAVFADLRDQGVDVLTLGQYLRPTPAHLPVARYYHPDEFAQLGGAARAMGFAHIESGPLVRSSYHAEEQAAPILPRAAAGGDELLPVVNTAGMLGE